LSTWRRGTRVRRLERGGFAYIGAVEAAFDTIKT
jgi:hypothetical protein